MISLDSAIPLDTFFEAASLPSLKRLLVHRGELATDVFYKNKFTSHSFRLIYFGFCTICKEFFKLFFIIFLLILSESYGSDWG